MLRIMDEHSGDACNDMKIVFSSLKLTGDLLNQQNLIGSEIIELRYVLLNQFKSKIDDVLANSTSVFDHYLPEIKKWSSNPPLDKVVQNELIITELSVNFKAFIIISKGILDKIIPFFDYMQKSTLKKFSKKGKTLINYLENNYTNENKEQFVLFLKKNKEEWIDFLISMRDSYVHFSDVSSHYVGFNFLLGTGVPKIETIKDINPPLIKKESKYVNALQYLEETYLKLLHFLRDFMQYSGYVN